MYTLLSPGVQVNEVDFSDYVAASASCIVGMVGGARRGPLTPTLVTSQEEFLKIFGTPSTKEYGAYSALEALTQVSQLYYQRVVHTPTSAKAGEHGIDKLIFTAASAGTKMNNILIDIEVTADTDFSVTISKTAETGTEVLETYENLSIDPVSANFVGTMINGESDYVTVILSSEGTLATKQLTLKGGTDGATYGTAGGADKAFSIKTKYLDSTLNYCLVKFTQPDAFGYFDMFIYNEDRSQVIEQLKDLSLDPADERYVDIVVKSGSNNIEVTYNAGSVGEDEDISAVEYIIMGGTDSIENPDKFDIIAGLEKFANPEVIDINLLAAPGWYEEEIVKAGIKVCTDRGDSLFITGTPFGLSAQQANDWANGTGEFAADHAAYDSSYGALYWPWLQVSDSYTRQNIWLPPEGPVLAQIAYNDRVGQPWFAPAGLNRGLMSRPLAVEYSATKGERDTIYGNRNIVNPIINYMGSGIVIWGQKTMQRKATALDRVNVRRLMNYIKKIISASTSYYVFEPNDSYSWNKWVDMVEPKLENIKNLRGLYEYKVQMSPTVSEVENNIMPGTIWIKPTKTAEFIPLNFMIAPYGASFEEEALAQLSTT